MCGEPLRYGVNCPKCGHQLKIPKGNLNINYPQHKSSKKKIIKIVIVVIVLIFISNMVIGISNMYSPENKLKQERDAYFEAFENFQINYQNENDPNYYSSAP